MVECQSLMWIGTGSLYVRGMGRYRTYERPGADSSGPTVLSWRLFVADAFFGEAQGWRFGFIGGLAVQRLGEPRQTRDVDLTVLTGFGQEEPFIDALLGRFDGWVEDAQSFALDNRVLLLKSEGGIGIDVALGGLNFEESAVTEATEWRIGPGMALRTCSAEALVVYKVFAGRPH